MMQISAKLGCSSNKVTYWMDKHGLQRRSISEASYTKANPNGDPFTIKPIETMEEAELFGLGVGLFWGEGAKTSKHSVKLGNTDALLLKSFMKFLTTFYGINKNDFRFSLQIFTDLDHKKVLNYWTKELDVHPWQFYKPTVTISGSIGTYRKKSQYGVVMVHYHNMKLRDIIVGLLPR
jgi:hypothetical protein